MQLNAPHLVADYDGENRIVRLRDTANGQAIVSSADYDGEGRRIRRTAGSVTTYYVYDANGQLMAEYGGTPAIGTQYLVTDHLGSTRALLDANETLVAGSRVDYAPHGGELVRAGWSGYGTTPLTTLKFTGKERDAETGLDYFGARYFSGAQGRFTSPDAPLMDQNPADPQSWNLYSYGKNNPLRFIDPSGMVAVSAEDCAQDSSCVSVKLNVILDQNAALYDRQGNLLPEYQKKLDQQIANAQNEYGDYNVHFDVSIAKGEFKNERGVLTIASGLDKGAINVGVTDSNQIGNINATGRSGCVGGYCASLLNIVQSNRDTLPHEIAHHLAGDTSGQKPTLIPGLREVVGMLLNTGADLRTDFIRATQFGPRPVPAAGYETNYGMFNRGARRFGSR